jgi:spore maturation protein CgeB
MKLVYFAHAIASCWNNGNAHFLRGVGTALQELGHEILFCEPSGGWSESNLVADHGPAALDGFRNTFPHLRRTQYDAAAPDLAALTDGADLVLVHEWNDPALVNALGRLRRGGAPFLLFFHDTHHRAISQPGEMARFALNDYDGVLAFGAVLAEVYRRRGWGGRAFVWHEAADSSLFTPQHANADGDLVWIGNWGDEERSDELREFLLAPAEALGLRTRVYGVRYPLAAREELARRGLEFCGWLPNSEAPNLLGRHRATMHVPRRPYVKMLPGIPTIRVFEALACGTPLVCAPWDDAEALFPEGCYLTARGGDEMRRCLERVMSDRDLRRGLREKGLRTIAERHTCRHRAEELLGFYSKVKSTRTVVTEAA